MNRTAFFASIRQTLFKSGLKQSHVDTIDAILDEAEKRGTPIRHLSYILATARHEPGADMEPTDENLYYTTTKRIRAVWPTRFKSDAAAKPFLKNPRALANKVYNGRMGNRPGSDDGWDFRAQGLVGITGRDNFARASDAIGIDLVANPALASRLDVAILILFEGMERGWFTGRTLAQGDATPGYLDERAIVNGTDQAALIAGYAEAFESALRAAKYGVAAPSPVDPMQEDDEAVEALRDMIAWRARAPENYAATLAWLIQMPKGVS